MRKIAAALAAAAASAAIVLGPSAPALAAPQCIFTPQLPARISVGQDVVGMTAKIRVQGSGCAQDMDVDTQLVHSTDSFYLMWDSTKPDVESVYAYEIVPGIYRTTASTCYAYDSDYNELSCTVKPASTEIKFAGHAALRVSRDGARVTFHALAARYDDFAGSKRMTDKVSIQRLSRGTWRTIHTAIAKAGEKRGYSWTYRHRSKAKYRAVSAETSAAFAGTSHTVTK